MPLGHKSQEYINRIELEIYSSLHTFSSLVGSGLQEDDDDDDASSHYQKCTTSQIYWSEYSFQDVHPKAFDLGLANVLHKAETFLQTFRRPPEPYLFLFRKIKPKHEPPHPCCFRRNEKSHQYWFPSQSLSFVLHPTQTNLTPQPSLEDFLTKFQLSTRTS